MIRQFLQPSLGRLAPIILMALFAALLAATAAPPAGAGTTKPAYQYVGKWGSAGSTSGKFMGAAGVAVDSSGDVHVADLYNDRIQVFSSSGAYKRKYAVNAPVAVHISVSDDVYVIDGDKDKVIKFSGGNFTTPDAQWGSRGTGNSQFKYAAALTTNATGDVYVSDAGNHRIQRFSSSGAFLGKWGSNGTDNGKLNYPAGIAANSTGDIFVADAENNRIQRFSSAGKYLSKWGSVGYGSGRFDGPEAIAVDASGDVYVTEIYNSRVQRFSASGSYMGQWGRYGSGNARFDYPSGIALTPAGRIFISDMQFTYDKYDDSYVLVNSRVQIFRPVTPPTSVVTLATSKGKISYGSSVTLSGTLKDSYGKAIPNVTVKIQSRKPGGSWVTERKTMTSGNGGTFSGSYAPKQKSELRAVFSGANGYTGDTSEIKTLKVAAKLSLSIPSTAKYGKSFTMTAVAYPNHSGKTIYLQLQQSTGAWKTVKMGKLTKVTAASSKAVFKSYIDSKKKYTLRYRLYFPGDADHEAAYSGARTIRVN